MQVGIKNEVAWYQSVFNDFEKTLNGHAQSGLHKNRKSALEQFAQTGFPIQKWEEWRFTNIAPIAHVDFQQSSVTHDIDADVIRNVILGDDNQDILVFVNGRFDERNSRYASDKIEIKPLSKAFVENEQIVNQHLFALTNESKNPFTTLNSAFANEGVFIHVPANTIVERPVQIVCFSIDEFTPVVSHPRNLILVGNNSQFSVIENFVGHVKNNSFTNPVTEVLAGDNTIVEHIKVQQESENTYHVGSLHFIQGRDSQVKSHNFSFGGSIARNDLNFKLNGTNADALLNGLYLPKNKQLIDNHSIIEHIEPHCHSRQVYKGVLDQQAKAVFSGKIHVYQKAQKTDAEQSNQNLLLSDDATIDTKPQLEIFADDVKCTHGGTVGQLDEEGIFYLQSRGINENTAKNMMIEAFVNDVTNQISIESIREELLEKLNKQLQNGHLVS